jgi:hypothetical protein
MLYLDTSALVKKYIEESGSPEVMNQSQLRLLPALNQRPPLPGLSNAAR